MSATSVADQLCQYFGGNYDSLTHTYRHSQLTVPGVAMGAVRRGKSTNLDNSEFYLGIIGARTGCIIWILLTPGDEVRDGFGGSLYGLKRVPYEVMMECAIRCESGIGEDTRDAQYALNDAIKAHLRADRTCGSGGIEAGGFQVGEDPRGIRAVPFEPVSRAGKTEGLLLVTFTAVEYVIA